LSPSRLATLLLDSIKNEELSNMISDASTSDIVLLNGMRDRETFIDWNSVSNTIS
jgi:hypothetical protein